MTETYIMKQKALLLFLTLLLLPFIKASAQENRIPEMQATTTPQRPVVTAAQLYHLGGDTIEVVVRIMIHPDHVIFANVDPAEQHLTTDVRIAAPKGFKKIKAMSKPVRQLVTTGTNTYIYKDDCVFRQKYKGNAQGDFSVSIKYECMSAQHETFQPQSVDYNLKQ